MDNNRAKDHLNTALLSCQSGKPKFSVLNLNLITKIESILLGEHLTFRYILFTALLAKRTDSRIHMRALQAGSDLIGAYDARSLCHSVVVPFDKNHLHGKLGNSNEPFLNKPARYPSIEKDNPVRAGKDKECLYQLYDVLEELNRSIQEVHHEALTLALDTVLKRHAMIGVRIKLPNIKRSAHDYFDIISPFLIKSFEGQAPVSVVTAILRQIYKDTKVVPHPPNQAGSSSKEIGDIDLYKKENFYAAYEIKDKTFRKTDVKHAVLKVLNSGFDKLVFAMGHNGNLSDGNIESLEREAAKNGFDLTFTNVDAMVRQHIAICTQDERTEFLELVLGCLIEIRAKDSVIKFLTEQLGAKI